MSNKSLMLSIYLLLIIINSSTSSASNPSGIPFGIIHTLSDSPESSIDAYSRDGWVFIRDE